jgi:hypothetical protein
MDTSVLLMISLVFFSGAVGGVVNAVITQNKFVLPKNEFVDEENSVTRPGLLANIVIGGIGSTVSWGLYGPLSSYLIVGTPAHDDVSKNLGLPLAALVGSVLVGIAVARWLTNEVDKNLLKAAASRAAGSIASTNAAQQIAYSSPARAFAIAKSMRPQ